MDLFFPGQRSHSYNGRRYFNQLLRMSEGTLSTDTNGVDTIKIPRPKLSLGNDSIGVRDATTSLQQCQLMDREGVKTESPMYIVMEGKVPPEPPVDYSVDTYKSPIPPSDLNMNKL